MASPDRIRRWLLALALAATVAAAGWVGGKEENGVVAATGTRDAARPPPAQRPADAARPATGGSAIAMDKLAHRAVARDFGEMFQARNRQPPPAPAAPRAAEPPRAPPLPFRFFGRLVEGGDTVVFLDRQDEIYAVKRGDTIAGAWRVENITGTEVVLTYLPLKQRQTLPIGAIE